ncbi:uncharacterized protein B0H18DRAFT_961493 [Fomitopsis serialis]|uniref:uncharacterized protein n=1 Tax=Fomitopsis serialis TaxID=139415 RepID=UPI002008363C|nr:uncharacterized protein B0H18DRAFT_961493 [Neoantrodia serialis]KAH9911987.1 hypothetical protein B0H18DRAFT_961493 [Neoantrodia serialis]
MALDQHTIVILAGPKLLGYFFNWCLLGVLGLQTLYFILVFEIVQTGLVTGVAFETFVYNYGDPMSLTRIYYAWFFVAVMCAIVSVSVQAFFAWRIWVLAKKPWRGWIAGGIGAVRDTFQILSSRLVLTKLTIALTVIPAARMCGSNSRSVTPRHGLHGPCYDFARRCNCSELWVIGSAVVDVLIAVTMTTLTERMINKVIRMVVETGSLTASIAVTTLVLCLRLPGTQYYETTIYVLTKLYANTFLANLISRAFFDPARRRGRGRSGTTEETDETDDTESGAGPGRVTTIALSTYVSGVPVWTNGEVQNSTVTGLRTPGSTVREETGSEKGTLLDGEHHENVVS